MSQRAWGVFGERCWPDVFRGISCSTELFGKKKSRIEETRSDFSNNLLLFVLVPFENVKYVFAI
jgi:hypothetical protein